MRSLNRLFDFFDILIEAQDAWLQQTLQTMSKLFSFALAYREDNLAGCSFVDLRKDAWLHVFNDAHDIVHLGVGEGLADLLFHLSGFDGGMADGVGCSLAIRNYEPAGTQVDTSIVAYDNYKNVCQFVAVDLSQDGLPGCG